MSAHTRASCAADKPVAPRPLQIGFGVRAVVVALAPMLAACAEAPRAPVAGSDPSDPGARAPRVGYRSTIAPYDSRRPLEPAPWGEQNQRVAPQPKSGHENHQ